MNRKKNQTNKIHSKTLPLTRKKFHKFFKFILIGIWNTLSGIAIFSLLYYFLHARFHYMLIVIIANIIGITNAYIAYKIFVFKTRGNYLREYLRFYVVYGFVFGLSLLLFPLFMSIIIPFIETHLHINQNLYQYNAYLSQLGVAAFTPFISYFGHEHFSYRKKRVKPS